MGSIISGIAGLFGGGASAASNEALMQQQEAMYQQQQQQTMESQMLQSAHDTAMTILKSIAS